VICEKAIHPHFSGHWRLGIIEKPNEFLEGNTYGNHSFEIPNLFLNLFRVFHILDSLLYNSFGVKEEKQLQMILLKLCKDEDYKKGRIKTNIAKVIIFVSLSSFNSSQVPQVPCQQNSTDCGCFLIYFAKTFMLNPGSTMSIIKVVSFISGNESD